MALCKVITPIIKWSQDILTNKQDCLRIKNPQVYIDV